MSNEYDFSTMPPVNNDTREKWMLYILKLPFLALAQRYPSKSLAELKQLWVDLGGNPDEPALTTVGPIYQIPTGLRGQWLAARRYLVQFGYSYCTKCHWIKPLSEMRKPRATEASPSVCEVCNSEIAAQADKAKPDRHYHQKLYKRRCELRVQGLGYCSNCKQVKPLADMQKPLKYGLSYYCKECKK